MWLKSVDKMVLPRSGTQFKGVKPSPTRDSPEETRQALPPRRTPHQERAKVRKDPVRPKLGARSRENPTSSFQSIQHQLDSPPPAATTSAQCTLTRHHQRKLTKTGQERHHTLTINSPSSPKKLRGRKQPDRGDPQGRHQRKRRRGRRRRSRWERTAWWRSGQGERRCRRRTWSGRRSTSCGRPGCWCCWKGVRRLDVTRQKEKRETYQLWQMTDEMVVTGTLTVQGQSEMVRVVAW